MFGTSTKNCLCVEWVERTSPGRWTSIRSGRRRTSDVERMHRKGTEMLTPVSSTKYSYFRTPKPPLYCTQFQLCVPKHGVPAGKGQETNNEKTVDSWLKGSFRIIFIFLGELLWRKLLLKAHFKIQPEDWRNLPKLLASKLILIQFPQLAATAMYIHHNRSRHIKYSSFN